MSAERPTTDHYDALLADLESKKAAIEALIAYVKIARAGGFQSMGEIFQVTATPVTAAQGHLGYSGSSPIQADDIPAGAFHGKSMPEAIKAYLAMVKKKQTLKEIADALKRGGLESTSSKFEMIVYNTLRRLQGRELLKSGDGWGMAEWWPASMRTAQKTNLRKSTKSKRTRFPKGKSQSLSSESGRPAKTPTSSRSGATRGNILKLLDAAGSEGAMVDEIAQALGSDAKGVRLLLGRMASSWHDAEKIGNDKYRIVSKP